MAVLFVEIGWNLLIEPVLEGGGVNSVVVADSFVPDEVIRLVVEGAFEQVWESLVAVVEVVPDVLDEVVALHEVNSNVVAGLDEEIQCAVD